MTKLYKEVQPYGKLTVLETRQRYYLLSPMPMYVDTWLEEWNMIAWSVVPYMGDVIDGKHYSKELNKYLYDEPVTLIINPSNICVELMAETKPIMLWTGEEMDEPVQETIDLSEDDNYLSPNYLIDIVNEPLDEQYPAVYMDDGFPE